MSALIDLLHFVFGCRHRHLSRVFTIQRRTYKVCFDCGREFDLPDAQAPKGSVVLLGAVLSGSGIQA
jgi:hypothetical protein